MYMRKLMCTANWPSRLVSMYRENTRACGRCRDSSVSGLALEMKKNMPAVSTPAIVACFGGG